MSSLNRFGLICLSINLFSHVGVSFDYGAALTSSILYYEAQRSGKLPPNQRVNWRGDSGLQDGEDAGINLVGGYHDSGDNVKFGFPMAFTITMLAWSTIDFHQELTTQNQLEYAKQAIKWGTDYLIKAHPRPNILYGQVGDGNADHQCWQRPEDIETPKAIYKIDEQNPGADLAGETAAALAAASIVFNEREPEYASLLVTHAKQLFELASKHPGQYQNSISGAGQFYSSSGYEDELLWAAAWLYRATNDQVYLNYLASTGNTGGVRSQLSWDDKFVGAQVLAAQLLLGGKVQASGIWTQYKSQAEAFICNVIQKGNNNIKLTPGGLLWVQPWNNLQYTTAASFITTVYAKYLSAAKASLSCPAGTAQPSDLIAFAKSQVDYILGENPKNMSYMVGYETKYPLQVHHRAASIVSIKKDPTPVTCNGGFDLWFNKNAPNPNVLQGAVIGGPNESDEYTDLRSNYQSNEPSTITVAPLVGVLASLA